MFVSFKEWVGIYHKSSNLSSYFFFGFLAVLADSLKSIAVGAPLLPTLRMVSPEPALIRLRLALMFA
jgi:hypothetical protein